MTKSKLITVLSDYHQKEYDEIYHIANYADWDKARAVHNSVTARMAWLEYQAKLKVESILELCRTGK